MTGPARPQYSCGNERRREVVRLAGTLNGIDFVEVDPTQHLLDVHFLHPIEGAGALPGVEALTAAHVLISGGMRVRDVAVVDAVPSGSELAVTVDEPGDFSSYELRLAQPGAVGDVPTGYDTRLSSVQFSFKAACASEVDCAPDDECLTERLPEPSLDYLAKDYDSLRRLMLDRMTTTLPAWTERHPADLEVTLVELLAYVADHLSYTQDAVATEAYLGTARRRSSVRRHARLLDYDMSEGVSARTFLHFQAGTGLTVPAGTAASAGVGATAPVFETLHDVAVRAAHNQIALHTWSDESCCLPRGATRATLVGGPDVDLRAGDLLLLEEVAGPDGGAPDPAHRQVVRLVEAEASVDRLDDAPLVEVRWGKRDALTFPLCVSVPGAITGVARGNIALADHGARRPATTLPAEVADPPGPWCPLVPEGPLAMTIAYDEDLPAVSLLRPDVSLARPAIVLLDGDLEWQPQRHLLGAGPTDPVFVVETEDEGPARLRFGDDEYGRRPARGAPFLVVYRLGGGSAGNVACDAVDRLVAALSGVTGVRNPVPGVGGADAEPTERARLVAPQAFRTQQRAVTEDDYATIAAGVDGVQRSAARLRWTGSWYTAAVTVDREGGGELEDDDLGNRLRAALDRTRLTGVDVAVKQPVPVALDVALDVCVLPGFVAADVGRSVERRLSAGLTADGRRGLFHPDELTLGQPVYLSRIYAAALEVPGVAWLRATRFRRLGAGDAGELDAGVLRVTALEVAELAADRERPERGRLVLTLVGGL